jgi:hypothetical protein
LDANGSPDWVELHNPTATQISLQGWTFEEVGSTNVFVFKQSPVLAANGFLVLYCDTTANSGDVAKFSLGRNGETLILRDSSGAIVDVLRYGPQVVGRTLGRIDGKLQITNPTAGAENTATMVGSPSTLVINEWLANAAAGESDWIEIYNTDSALPVSLRGVFVGVSNQVFEITSASFVGAGGYVRLFADEGADPDSLDFKLPAAGGRIQLLDSVGELIDEVHYTAQEENVTEGRYPDATDNILRFPVSPSPGAPNQLRFPLGVSASVDGISLSWPSVAGRIYRIETSENLVDWASHREVTAVGSATTAGEPSSGNSRYFRVIALP